MRMAFACCLSFLCGLVLMFMLLLQWTQVQSIRQDVKAIRSVLERVSRLPRALTERN